MHYIVPVSSGVSLGQTRHDLSLQSQVLTDRERLLTRTRQIRSNLRIIGKIEEQVSEQPDDVLIFLSFLPQVCACFNAVCLKINLCVR